MTMRVFVGGDDLIDLVDEITEETLPIAVDAVDRGADVLLAKTQELLRRRRGPESAPEGEPPAAQTEALVKSFRKLKPRVQGRVVTSGIRSDAEAVNRLEFGATDSRGIVTKPHPFLRPAVEQTEGAITKLLEDAL